MLARPLVVLAALVATACAQLTITSPSSDIWWVANSPNTLAWTCSTSPYTEFTVYVNNNDTSLLSGSLAIFSIEQNYNCEQTVTPTLAVGSGFWISFGNPLNGTDVYAVSSAFEVKAQGSVYPSSSTSSGPSATGSGAASSASASTGTTTSGSSHSFTVHEGVVGALAAVAGLFAL